MASPDPIPALSWLVLLAPRKVQGRLAEAQAAGRIRHAPTAWQVTLGVLRMWHRVFFRPETIGTCTDFSPRSTWRAQVLRFRPLRGPFLLWERAIAPWDQTGLLSSTERVRRHLLGAHHDRVQFAYDFELLLLRPGALEAVRDEAAAVVDGSHPRADWLRDLTVYERYHEELLAAAGAVLDGAPLLSPEEQRDPDISFFGYLDWCASQPATPAETWRLYAAGRYRFPAGRLAETP